MLPAADSVVVSRLEFARTILLMCVTIEKCCRGSAKSIRRQFPFVTMISLCNGSRKRCVQTVEITDKRGFTLTILR